VKVKLKILKSNVPVYEGIYDIRDANSFGKACADAWDHLCERKFESATSIGALYEALDEGVVNEIRGTQILLEEFHD